MGLYGRGFWGKRFWFLSILGSEVWWKEVEMMEGRVRGDLEGRRGRKKYESFRGRGEW